MIQKFTIILFSWSLVNAGILGTDYSPATSVSYSSFSTAPIITKSVETPLEVKTIQPIAYTNEQSELSPIYDSVLSTRENKFITTDGSQHRTFSKSLNTGDSKINKFEARTTNGISYASYSSPVYTEAIYKSGTYSEQSTSPIRIVSTVQSPVTYVQAKPVSYVAPITKSISTYSIGASPIVYNTKVTPGLSAYASDSFSTLVNAPSIEEHTKETVTYSKTPIVSQVTFSGSDTSYSW